ncbi:glycoside hydrolase family 43 protein [Mucilaginibacter endophyticus]|uniref:glycoside hydrolase family 43 protein n=1 Tax=Mucilaginibacter endophyticus TaxID=2675003 RepID=UPI001ABFD566|nr:glycoside hydrolase 43 family protein [Mucilaginibacter endophyticus]
MIRNLLTGIAVLFLMLTSANNQLHAQQRHPGAWGDQFNGTYKNPIINADYSDPDVIRVGGSFYMICSDFHFMGMPVLQSTDLVNWRIIGQVYNRLDLDPKYNTMEKYGAGSWAPSLRYHNGKFYVYFCTPDEGLYMSSTTNPAGKWSPLTEVKRTGGWEDPCPFWDTDGQAYLGHSRLGAGPIIIHKMSADGKHLLDSGKTVYEGPVAEGTKIYKRNGYYYIIIPEGGVGTGYETALRSKSIYGPYERKIVLEQGKTNINGPHQGGIVELDNGEAWFIHFQDAGAIGRVCHLEPVKWQNDWPFIGIDNDGNGIGEPVSTYPKPKVNKFPVKTGLQTSDQFNKTTLGLQWQWNHNPVNDKWSLKAHKGYLALTAMQATNNKYARNTITQKLMGRNGMITTTLNADQLTPGQKAGLCLLGNYIHEIGLIKTDTGLNVYADNNGKFQQGITIGQKTVFLRLVINLDHTTVMQYSLDGKIFTQLGEACTLSNYNYWKAVRPGLFSYNTKQPGGTALFDWFSYLHDGPEGGL